MSLKLYNSSSLIELTWTRPVTTALVVLAPEASRPPQAASFSTVSKSLASLVAVHSTEVRRTRFSFGELRISPSISKPGVFSINRVEIFSWLARFRLVRFFWFWIVKLAIVAGNSRVCKCPPFGKLIPVSLVFFARTVSRPWQPEASILTNSGLVQFCTLISFLDKIC